jgi:hypothetical protein
MYIRIIDVPPGEAPEWVRQAWVGLELPLVRGEDGPRYMNSHGVLSGRGNWFVRLWRQLTGAADPKPQYAVRVIDAMDVLDDANPEAAAWWHENTPHLIRPQAVFGFAPEVCEEID